MFQVAPRNDDSFAHEHQYVAEMMESTSQRCIAIQALEDGMPHGLTVSRLPRLVDVVTEFSIDIWESVTPEAPN